MSFYRRFFFKCTECNFMLTLLGQANREVECCPSCGEATLDYAPKQVREEYIELLLEELEDIEIEE
jgi:rRNA maturation endonuclease Nob1